MEGLIITSYYGCTCGKNIFNITLFDQSEHNVENPIYCRLTCFHCNEEYKVNDITDSLHHAGLVKNEKGLIDKTTVEKIKIKMK